MPQFLIIHDDLRLGEVTAFADFLKSQQNQVTVTAGTHILFPKAPETVDTISQLRKAIVDIANSAGLTECKIFIARLTGNAAWHNISNFKSDQIKEVLTAKEPEENTTTGG